MDQRPVRKVTLSQLPMLSAVQIAADRVLLRKARDADRERLIELQTDPKVWAYLGGPRLREAVEHRLDAIGPTNVIAAPGVLRAAADELPDQPVIIVTQTANERSLRLAVRLGFQPVSTFELFDAEQTLGLASLHSFKA